MRLTSTSNDMADAVLAMVISPIVPSAMLPLSLALLLPLPLSYHWPYSTYLLLDDLLRTHGFSLRHMNALFVKLKRLAR